MITTTQLLVAVGSFLISLLMTPVVRLVAINNGWVARPREDRWHKKTTALMGGIAIFCGIGIPLLMVGNVHTLWQRFAVPGSSGDLPDIAIVILGGATILFLLGVIDDFYSLKPQSKLIGQIIVSSVVVFLGFRLNWFVSMTLDTMVTLIWIVGITNSFNLLDNMDGLCAGVAMVAAFALAVLYSGHDASALTVALVIGGACGGFLVYNFNPASIFMGDCGSLVIGFALAVLSLYHGEFATDNPLSAVTVPLLILMVPLLDTTLVTIIRLLSGRKASTGGRDHTSHRLVLMGFSEKSAVLCLYGIGTISGLAGIIVSRSDTITSPAVIIPIALAIFLMGVYLSQLRVYPEKEFSVLRGRRFTPVLIELTYKRHITLVILDLGLIAFSYYLAYRLRFGGAEFAYYFKIFLESLPAIIAAKMLVLFFMGIYRGFWQYLSTRDVFHYIRSSSVATIVAIACVTLLYRFDDFSKGVFVIDWFLTTGLLLVTRGSFRLFTETMKRQTLKGERVVIYGAGRGGELLLREILNNPSLNIKPVGFIDDDPLKVGRKIQGFKILGHFDLLGQLRHKHAIEGVLLSFNGKENAGALQNATSFCRQNGLSLKKFSIQLKPVDINKK